MLLPQTFFPDLPVFLLLLGDDQLARPVATAHEFIHMLLGPFSFHREDMTKFTAEGFPIEVIFLVILFQRHT